MKKEIIRSKNKNIKLPYILIIPDNYNNDSRLIVELSGSGSIDKTIDEQINEICISNRNNSIDYMLYLLTKELNYPIMIPVLPRLSNYYVTYLPSKVLHNDFTGCDITDREKNMLSNIYEQIKLMIEETTEYLNIEKK